MVAATAIGVIAAFAALATVVVVASRRRSVRRQRETEETLDRAGFRVAIPRDEVERGGLFAGLGPMRYLGGGARGVRWSARGVVKGNGVTLVLHRAAVDRDDHVESVHTTVATTPCPRGWPVVRVVPRSVGSGVAGPMLENAEFSGMFRVETLNDDFAILALTPGAQGLIVALAAEFQDPVVGLGEGVLAVAVPGALGAEQLIGLARRTGELRAAIRPM